MKIYGPAGGAPARARDSPRRTARAQFHKLEKEMEKIDASIKTSVSVETGDL